METKICAACGEDKPLESFWKNKGGVQGRHSKCATCKSQDKQAFVDRYNERNATRLIVCTRCRKEKPFPEYSKVAGSYTEPKALCTACDQLERKLQKTCKDCGATLTARFRNKSSGRLCRTCLSMKERRGVYGDSVQVAHECEICHKQFVMELVGKVKQGDRPCTDHNHTTGEVRGTLCSRCNSMLGYAKEKISTLEAAIQYLLKYNPPDPLV